MAGPSGLERRAVPMDLRAAGRRLEGYAATFDTEARIADFVEVILPGAFRGALSPTRDVLALVDHDPGKVLARTRSGTLRLAEDPRGLSFSLELPNTQAGRDVLALAERGDLGGHVVRLHRAQGRRTVAGQAPRTARRDPS
jgi:HK97 family phage prohead protease